MTLMKSAEEQSATYTLCVHEFCSFIKSVSLPQLTKKCSRNILLMFLLIYKKFFSECLLNIENIWKLDFAMGFKKKKKSFNFLSNNSDFSHNFEKKIVI